MIKTIWNKLKSFFVPEPIIKVTPPLYEPPKPTTEVLSGVLRSMPPEPPTRPKTLGDLIRQETGYIMNEGENARRITPEPTVEEERASIEPVVEKKVTKRKPRPKKAKPSPEIVAIYQAEEGVKADEVVAPVLNKQLDKRLDGHATKPKRVKKDPAAWPFPTTESMAKKPKTKAKSKKK